MFRQFFNRINNISLLGRWEHRLTDKQKELKLTYNNLDHCGDKICGDLLKYKNVIITTSSVKNIQNRILNEKN